MHNVFVSPGAVHSFVLYSLLSSCFKMASEKAKWSDYPHSYISGTQGVNTTPCCVVNTPALHGSREPSADTAPKIELTISNLLALLPLLYHGFSGLIYFYDRRLKLYLLIPTRMVTQRHSVPMLREREKKE